ncbi:MAG: carbon storage regulator [Planctomycetes bacterium]|nr:carbon storage regulator [Planctomycetota bacterium]
MLVLSRKIGERIHIGNDVFVEVRRVAGNRVTLAINAPKSVRILRGELMEAARAFDVLEDATASDVPAESSEAAIDTVVMSGEAAAAVLPSRIAKKTEAPKLPHSVS